MKKNDSIVISKSKLLKVVGISLGVILFIGISFSLSSSHGESYSESKSSEELSDEEMYEQAVKDSAAATDTKRKEPNEISVDDYLNLYKSDSQSIVLLSRPTCHYCQIATPIIENIIYEKDAKINYINTDELSEDDKSKLLSSDEYLANGYGTPLIIVVGNSKIIDKIEGLTTKNNYMEFFEEYGWGE